MEKIDWIKYEKDVREWSEGIKPQKHKERFLRDGIVNEKEWNKEGNVKTLFIFKEHYGRSTGMYINFLKAKSWLDLTDENEMNDIFKYPEWGKIATLAKGIEKAIVTGWYISKDDYHPEKCDHRKEINKIAIMNLKKLAGGVKPGSKRSQESMDYAEHCKRFSKEIREQIEYINPNFIVCCSEDVYKCLKRYIYPKHKREQNFFALDNGTAVVVCCQPAYEGINKENFKDKFFSLPANVALSLMIGHNEPLRKYYEKRYDDMLAEGKDYED